MPWNPPEDPDLHDILQSAVADTKAERFSIALDKFVWFHENAVRHRRSMSAVRRSFALGYWLNLAELYPPAKEAFIRYRDCTESEFRSSYDNYQQFADITSMNLYLGLEVRTADLFREAAVKSFDCASQYYFVAERSLVAAGYYLDCGPFIDHKKRLQFAKELYRMKLEREERPCNGVSLPKYAVRGFTHTIATLVALLVLNDRKHDAEELRRDAVKVLETPEFIEKLDAAFAGHLPSPRYCVRR